MPFPAAFPCAPPGSPASTANGKAAVRNLGKPVELAARYFAEGADEVTFLNITGFRDAPLEDTPMLEVRMGRGPWLMQLGGRGLRRTGHVGGELATASACWGRTDDGVGTLGRTADEGLCTLGRTAGDGVGSPGGGDAAEDFVPAETGPYPGYPPPPPTKKRERSSDPPSPNAWLAAAA